MTKNNNLKLSFMKSMAINFEPFLGPDVPKIKLAFSYYTYFINYFLSVPWFLPFLPEDFKYCFFESTTDLLDLFFSRIVSCTQIKALHCRKRPHSRSSKYVIIIMVSLGDLVWSFCLQNVIEIICK